MADKSTRRFRCAYCSKSYTRALNLRSHEKVHTNERPFRCSSCPSSFMSRDHCRSHEILHSPTKKFTCSSCSLDFHRSSTLKRHERSKSHLTATGNNKRGETDPEAGKKTAFRESRNDESEAQQPGPQEPTRSPGRRPDEEITSIISAHPKPQRSEPTFHCSVCGSSFARLFTLKRHHNTHTNLRLHTCSHCGRRFKRQDDCNNHESTHLAEKPFVCGDWSKQNGMKSWGCGRHFARADALLRHSRTKIGQRCAQSAGQSLLRRLTRLESLVRSLDGQTDTSSATKDTTNANFGSDLPDSSEPEGDNSVSELSRNLDRRIAALLSAVHKSTDNETGISSASQHATIQTATQELSESPALQFFHLHPKPPSSQIDLQAQSVGPVDNGLVMETWIPRFARNNFPIHRREAPNARQNFSTERLRSPPRSLISKSALNSREKAGNAEKSTEQSNSQQNGASAFVVGSRYRSIGEDLPYLMIDGF